MASNVVNGNQDLMNLIRDNERLIMDESEDWEEFEQYYLIKNLMNQIKKN